MTIREELQHLGLEAVLGALRTEIAHEAERLLALKPRPWTSRKRDEAYTTAENLFELEIDDAVLEPFALTPEAVLFRHRRAVVWAVATVLREARQRRCGRYIGDNDATCPQLTCIRPFGHKGLCDNTSDAP